MRRSVRVGCAAATLLAAALGAFAAPPELQPCRLRGVEHEALCGKLGRALDPQQPQGPRIDLHFAVLPALARRKQADPVFFIAGGPGQSAIALAGPVARMLGRLGQRRDIVLVDQRGTGRSAALECEPAGEQLPLFEAADPARQLQRARRCLGELQALPHGDLRQYTTGIAMADLDAVRQALGAERINLVAASYGTRAALEYARQHPQRVRRMVLDGVVPPDMMLPQAAAVDAQAALDGWLAACEAEPACRARHPQLRASWSALQAALPQRLSLEHPHTGRVEQGVLTQDMLLAMVRAALYAPVTGAALPAAIDAAAQGRFAPLAGLASALAAPRGAAAVAQGMHFAVLCSEDVAPEAGVPPAGFGHAAAQLYREVCAFWPRGTLPEGFRRMPPAPAPTLLLSGGLDPATPPRHGERVARALGANARHEVVPHAGHGVLALPCMRDVVWRFIDAADAAQALRVDAACARELPRPPIFVPLGAEEAR